MAEPVEFKIVRRDGKATCACGTVIAALPDGSFKVSPHLREAHGFSKTIDFEKTYEVICPPSIGMKAVDRG